MSWRALGCFVLLLTSSGLARAEGDLGRTGFYVGLAGVYAIEDFDGLGGVHVDDGVGGTVRAGYRFHPHLAAELQAEWIPSFDLDGSFGGNDDVEVAFLTLNGKAFLATGRVQPYLLAGVGAMFAGVERDPGPDSDDEGFGARLGLGTDIYVLPELAVVLEGSYAFATGDVDDLDYGSLVLGLQYRF